VTPARAVVLASGLDVLTWTELGGKVLKHHFTPSNSSLYLFDPK
jgi:hypothetical protein